MQTSKSPVPPVPAASKDQAAQPAPRGWTVKFLVPPPHTMPTQRLQARAELVRRALGCSNCTQY